MTQPAVEQAISFAADPSAYRHWRVDVEPPLAVVTMQVAADGGLRDDYELKLNTYDLGVDIELADIVQRLRFEHPEVGAVVLTSGLDRVFCAGANIQMLATSSHAHKVNFCKFTNETRNAIEEASAESGQVWIAAINGTAAGGGYELALACDEIVLVDDCASTVSLPEVPLLGVLPGTGGLTRLVDKRRVRRDLADAFSTRAEGVKGATAVEWGLVDQLAARTGFDAAVRERAVARAGRPAATGIALPPLGSTSTIGPDGITARHVTVTLDRPLGCADIVVTAPTGVEASTPEGLSAESWVIAAALELDHALLHLRANETEIGTWVLRTRGATQSVVDAEQVLSCRHWLAREARLLWGRTLRRLDLSARSLVALVEPGSCFAGTLAELLLAADRTLMCEEGATIRLTDANDGWYPMANHLSRTATRFWGRDDDLARARELVGKDLHAADALAAGLVTFVHDELDWDDEVRLTLEERASFSPDALTAMEANLRFAGPETMETKIFARLSAWQNWVFQRPNAAGPDGALRRFGSGSRPSYDRART